MRRGGCGGDTSGLPATLGTREGGVAPLLLSKLARRGHRWWAGSQGTVRMSRSRRRWEEARGGKRKATELGAQAETIYSRCPTLIGTASSFSAAQPRAPSPSLRPTPIPTPSLLASPPLPCTRTCPSPPSTPSPVQASPGAKHTA